MKNLPKNLLTKSLLLFIVLFFSGCSLFDVVDTVSGRIGVYTLNDEEYNFIINDNADSITDGEGYKLLYASRGYDYITYTGYDENNDLITVHLTELSDTKGVYTKYKVNAMQQIAGFSWAYDTIVHKFQEYQGSFLINGTTYTLYFGDDGFTFKDTYFYYTTYDLDMGLSRFGDDWIEYSGWVGNTQITVALIDITDKGGTYRRYEWNTQVAEIGFIWKQNI